MNAEQESPVIIDCRDEGWDNVLYEKLWEMGPIRLITLHSSYEEFMRQLAEMSSREFTLYPEENSGWRDWLAAFMFQRAPIGRDHARVCNAMRVLERGCFRFQENSQCIAIRLRCILPIGANRIPAVAQAFLIGHCRFG
jgi:hypothetical protein